MANVYASFKRSAAELEPVSGFRLKEYAKEDEGTAAKASSKSEPAPSEGSSSKSSIKTGGWNDTRNDVDADGKYLLLAVPEFKKGMSTYLRLGAACSQWDTQLGNELEKMIHATGPVGKATEWPFIDDERDRGQAAVHPGVGATRDESELLHTKGGWRDHSDGNRITTTFGDKIEIIRGNYKMIVLGRQDEPADSAGWDASGQHIQDWGYSMPGASVTLEWKPYWGGTWLLRNSTEVFHSWNRTAGNRKDEYWGDLLESYVGQEMPGENMPQSPAWPGGAPDPVLRTNPDIIEKTFAKSITSQTGSEKLPVPSIDESTWVTKSTSITTAEETTETTTVTGAVTGTTTAGSITETTTVEGAISGTTTAGSTTETTTVEGAITGTTTAGSISETTEAGSITASTTADSINESVDGGSVVSFEKVDSKIEFLTSMLHSSTEISGHKNENFIGTGSSISLGPRVGVSIPEATEISVEKIVSFLNKTQAGANASLSLAIYSVIAARIHLTGTVNIGLGGGAAAAGLSTAGKVQAGVAALAIGGGVLAGVGAAGLGAARGGSKEGSSGREGSGGTASQGESAASKAEKSISAFYMPGEDAGSGGGFEASKADGEIGGPEAGSGGGEGGSGVLGGGGVGELGGFESGGGGGSKEGGSKEGSGKEGSSSEKIRSPQKVSGDPPEPGSVLPIRSGGPPESGSVRFGRGPARRETPGGERVQEAQQAAQVAQRAAQQAQQAAQQAQEAQQAIQQAVEQALRAIQAAQDTAEQKKRGT